MSHPITLLCFIPLPHTHTYEYWIPLGFRAAAAHVRSPREKTRATSEGIPLACTFNDKWDSLINNAYYSEAYHRVVAIPQEYIHTYIHRIRVHTSANTINTQHTYGVHNKSAKLSWVIAIASKWYRKARAAHTHKTFDACAPRSWVRVHTYAMRVQVRSRRNVSELLFERESDSLILCCREISTICARARFQSEL